MSEPQPPPQEPASPRKTWNDPELAVFLMSDAEAPTPLLSGTDFGSNAS
jgi:hypothetical protein